MDIVQFFRFESRFPSACAIVTLTAIGERKVGECFLLVENGGPFLGFQRIRLPADASREAIDEAALAEARKIHGRMREAAFRHGRLASKAGETLDSPLISATPEDFAAGVARRDFAEHLDWISRNTASSSLRDWLRDRAVASGFPG